MARFDAFRSLPSSQPSSLCAFAPLRETLPVGPVVVGYFSMTRKNYLPFGKPNFSQEEVEAVTAVIRSGWVGMGPETIAFERELADYLGVPHVICVNSCTSALFLSLLVAGVGKGDEVVCPSLTWCSTANAALYLGARAVFCDVDAGSLCMTTESILEKVTRKTRAVVVVHFGGLGVDVRKLRAALPRRIAIIEDAAHAFGSGYPDGRKVGSSGNATCFSFYANKNLSTGEGGAIALFNSRHADRIRSLRQHALPIDAWKRFTHPKAILLSNHLTELGYKMNYTDLQACIGRVQLRRYGGLAKRRLQIAKRYVTLLGDMEPPLKFQSEITAARHARHLFTVQLGKRGGSLGRDEMLAALKAKNIGATLHYTPLHLMPLYGRKRCHLPVTETVSRSMLTLPISSSMTLDDAEYVSGHFRDILQRRQSF